MSTSNATSNLILKTDSYKASHYLQYPENTTEVFSYIESRGGRYAFTQFAGLQPALIEYLSNRITKYDIDEAESFFKRHGEPFNREGWEYILKKHDGFLPLRIRAVPEGMVVPVGNALVTVVNTDPNCAWLTSYFETLILRAVWYPTTVATRSYYAKMAIRNALIKSADSLDGLPFKLHDFGARGVSSGESAALGGMAHLFNFMGSDTVEGVEAFAHYYNTSDNEVMPAFSIPAAEHSTMTILGRDGEKKQMARMIDLFAKPGALFAVVSDSYNIWEACKTWGTDFKDKLVQSGATLIVRPDSGDPVQVSVRVLKELDKYFGSTVNSKGFKMLNNVRMIYGDGINDISIPQILNAVMDAGYSTDNMAMGMGGGLLQQCDRDTQRFAMKASAAVVNGVEVEVYKDPIDGSKTSKKGRVELYKSRITGEFRTYAGKVDSEWVPQMETVFENGEVIRQYSIDEVRKNTGLW